MTNVHKIDIENYYIGVDAYGNPVYVNLSYWNGDFNNPTALEKITAVENYANASYASRYTNDFKYLPVSGTANSKNKKSIVPGSFERGAHKANYNGYVYNRSSDIKIQIPLSSSPANVDETISANISTESPVGSVQPVVIFSSTGARIISFSISVYADYLPNGYASVKDYVTAFKQLCYPSIVGDNITPPECEFYVPGINVIGIATSVNITWGGTYKSNNPDSATIALSITETRQVVGGKVNV